MYWISNGKRIVPFLIMALALGCSAPRKGARLGTLQPELPIPVVRANHCFQEGKSLLEKGQIDKARDCFDEGIDLLLTANNGSPSTVGALRDYVDKVSALELSYLEEQGDKANGQHGSFLDEVIATPLFPPSQQEVASLQHKIEAAPQAVYSIPVVVNPEVVSFLNAFQAIRHDRIQRALDRGQEFISAFREIFHRQGIPEDLAYLPIIESGFRVGAVSRARARGIWQFMASTARLFGLRVDWLVDERLDPFKAAEGAGRYLKYLYDKYGDWYLALACYNGGPRRVEKAMNTLNARDFFEIHRSRHIRRETRNYVPAFIAAMIIAKSPQEYGFETAAVAEKALGEWKMATVSSPVDLNQAARLLQLSLPELKALNPELLTDYTPPNVQTYNLRIPSMADENILALLERVPTSRIPTHLMHRVRRGESLFSIARRYGSTVQQIKHVNGLRSNFIRPGQNLVIPRSRR